MLSGVKFIPRDEVDKVRFFSPLKHGLIFVFKVVFFLITFHFSNYLNNGF